MHPICLEVLEKDNFVNAIADTDIHFKILETRSRSIGKDLGMATDVVAFQISEYQRLRPGQLTTSLVSAQVSDKHRFIHRQDIV